MNKTYLKYPQVLSYNSTQIGRKRDGGVAIGYTQSKRANPQTVEGRTTKIKNKQNEIMTFKAKLTPDIRIKIKIPLEFERTRKINRFGVESL